MTMYKKAVRMKLRVQTKFGPLAVEQLWDLKLGDLAVVIKGLHEELKKNNVQEEELAFLDGPIAGKNKEAEEAQLRYDIVKDIYLTKQSENKDAISKLENKKKANRIAEILQKKEDEDLENKSPEELRKMLKELDV